MLPYLLAFFLTGAAAQGFSDMCTAWTMGFEDSTVYPWLFVAECADERGRNHISFLSLNECYANREGEMVPERNGDAGLSCGRCELDGSILECECTTTTKDFKKTLVDLNEVMKNENGIVACYDFLGIEIDSFESVPA